MSLLTGVLATGQPSPNGIAVDATNVYWINLGSFVGSAKAPGGSQNGQVMKCAKTGCGNHPTVLVAGLQQGIVYTPMAFAVRTDVYFPALNTGCGEVFKCSPAGCGAFPAEVARIYPSSIAVDDTNVYVAAGFSGISTAPVSGDGGLSPLWSGAQPAYGVAVDAANIYWTTMTGEVLKCPITGCAGGPATLASNEGNTRILAVDDVNVYWSDYVANESGRIRMCPKTGGASTNLASGRANSASGLVSDGSFVYWTDSSVWKCSVNGCNGNPSLVATSMSPVGVVVDDTTVYWADSANGSIMSAPK